MGEEDLGKYMTEQRNKQEPPQSFLQMGEG
jgi:hypothetical protein